VPLQSQRHSKEEEMSFCYKCGGDIDFKESWVKFIDDHDWFYHWKCYLVARRDGYMPKPDFIHKKGK